MPYLRVIAPLAGHYRDTPDGHTDFFFDDGRRIPAIFKSIGRHFVSKALKEAIESQGLTGLKYKAIFARSKSGKPLQKECFESFGSKRAQITDFYRYERSKIAAWDRAVILLEEFSCKEFEFIGLAETTWSEQMYAEFERERKAGKL